MGATVAMERSIEFRLLGFYTLWPYVKFGLASSVVQTSQVRFGSANS